MNKRNFFFFFLFFSFLSYCRSFVKNAFVVVVGALNCDELALSTIDIDWTTINNLDSIQFNSINTIIIILLLSTLSGDLNFISFIILFPSLYYNVSILSRKLNWINVKVKKHVRCGKKNFKPKSLTAMKLWIV